MCIFNGLIGLVLGVLLMPLFLFIRAKRDGAWDDSNIFNMYRLVAHITLHPSDFGKMYYKDGKKPFDYINKDEFAEVVDSRPNKSNQA